MTVPEPISAPAQMWTKEPTCTSSPIRTFSSTIEYGAGTKRSPSLAVGWTRQEDIFLHLHDRVHGRAAGGHGLVHGLQHAHHAQAVAAVGTRRLTAHAAVEEVLDLEGERLLHRDVRHRDLAETQGQVLAERHCVGRGAYSLVVDPDLLGGLHVVEDEHPL